MYTTKDYNNKEKELQSKYKKDNRPIVVLDDDDFEDNELSIDAYEKIKNKCKYIGRKDHVTLKVPKKFESIFKTNLEMFIANETYEIKNDRKGAEKATGILFIMGAIFFAIAQTLAFKWHVDSTAVIIQVVGMASYIFVWTAIEKWFFERTGIQKDRRRILQIADATINFY